MSGHTPVRTALVIEDDEGLRDTMEALLGLEGWAVVLARDGVQALEMLERLDPTVILLDLMMPRMNGYELAAQMRQRHLHPDTPIIVLTADIRASQRADDIGAKGFLIKPFDLPELLAEIQRVCV